MDRWGLSTFALLSRAREAHQRLTRAGRGGPAWRLAALPRAERADRGPLKFSARSARRFAIGSSPAAGSGYAASPLGARERMSGRCRRDQHVAPPLGCQALWGTQGIHKLFGRGNAIDGWKGPARLAAQIAAIGQCGANNAWERRVRMHRRRGSEARRPPLRRARRPRGRSIFDVWAARSAGKAPSAHLLLRCNSSRRALRNLRPRGAPPRTRCAISVNKYLKGALMSGHFLYGNNGDNARWHAKPRYR